MSEGRLLRRLLLASLLLRLVVWIPVAHYHVPAVFDETGYAARARAYGACAAALLRGRAPAPADAAAAYDGGFQPPLHPLLLGLWGLPGGGRLGWLRLWPVLLTALATPLVWRLGRRLAGRRAAAAAAGLHLLSPTVTFYSHTLWSEPLFTLLLLAGADRLLAARDRHRDGASAARPAALAGLLLGLAAVTRVEGLVALAAAAAWAGWRMLPRRALLAPLLLAGLLPVAAWEGALLAREGRPAPLTTSGGFNLLLGNNPLVATAAGSSWRDDAALPVLRRQVAAAADSLGVPPDVAARRLAAADVARRPGRAALRMLARWRLFWSPDLFPARHVAQVVYPPLPDGALPAVWLATTFCFLLTLALALDGLLRGLVRERSLLLGAAAALMLPASLAIAMSRLHFPVLVLWLPAAGAALAARVAPVRAGGRPRRLLWWEAALIGLALAVSLSAVPVQLRRQLGPSWSVHRVLDRVAARWAPGLVYRDLVMLRPVAAGDETAPADRDTAAAWTVTAGGDTVRWRPGATPWLPVVVTAPVGGTPRLTVSGPAGDSAGETLSWQPVRRDAWQRWRPVPAGAGTAGPRLEYRWAGGV